MLAATAVLAAGLTTSGRERPAAAAPAHRAIAVRAGGVMLRAVRAGAGPTVVLIHGYGESLLSWEAVFDRLARRADVVALDLPGFGLSAKPATGYGTDSVAATVLRALDAIHVGRAVMVGHSLGGAVAAAAAVQRPDRVRGLVLLDAALAPAPWMLRSREAGDRALRAMRAAVAAYESAKLRFAGPHDPAWLAETDSGMAADPASDPAYSVALQAILREFDFGYLTPTRAARLRMPVLILWGEYDPTLPIGVARRLAEALPGSTLEVIPRSWHRPHVERPEAVADRLERFLAFLKPDSAATSH